MDRMDRAHEVVSLDMGWTLAWPPRPMREVYVDALAVRCGHTTTVDELGAAMDEVVPALAPQGAAMTMDDYRRDWTSYYQQILRRIGFDARQVERGVRCMWEVWENNTWRLYDDVTDALDDLRSLGYRLAIISNWTPDLERHCARLRLEVEAVFASAAIGYAKPHGRIFERAWQTLGVAPSQIVHVGDSASADVVGATAAGLDAVLVQRPDDPTRPEPGTGGQPAVDGPGSFLGTIASLAELRELLAG